MHSKERIILITSISILLALVFFLYSRTSPPDQSVDKYQTRIIDLQNQVQLAESRITPLLKRVDDYKLELVELDNSIVQKDLQILKLRKNVKEISTKVDTMLYPELTRFFSDRYEVTLVSKEDTALVYLPIQTARLVTKDLLIGDELGKENNLLSGKIILLERRNIVSDSTIAGQDSLINSYKRIGDLKTTQIETFSEKVNYLEKDNKSLEKEVKRKKNQRNFLISVVVGMVTYILI